METVFPCRSPEELPRNEQPHPGGFSVPATPSPLLDIGCQRSQEGSALKTEATCCVGQLQFLNNQQYSNNNSSSNTHVPNELENAAFAAATAALFGGTQFSNTNSSSAAHIETKVRNAGFETTNATIYSDTDIEVKPTPKRRRILDRCEVEADGLQFLNSYCLALAIDTDEKSVNFCQKLGLVPQKAYCPSCSETLSVVYTVRKKGKRSIFRFQCNKRKCKQSGKNTVGVRDKSWFQNSCLSFRKNLIIMKCFVGGLEIFAAIRESSVPEENSKGEMSTAITSSESVIDLYAACREICALSMLKLSAETEIGGPGKTVELGESTFERFKHVSAVQNHWLLAGICRETDKVFVDVVPTGDHETAIAVVRKHIKKGTHIITQCSTFIQCSSHLLQHGYSYSTGDTENSQKTNSKKNTETKHWQSVRKHFPFARITGGLFALHLAELLWRREHSQDRDPLRSFIGDITRVCQF